MTGWVKTNARGKWHWTLWAERGRRVVVACDPNADYYVRSYIGPEWVPPADQCCNRPACRREFES